MAYYCEDCSYRGVTSGDMGRCPACGSYNLVKRALPYPKEAAPAQWRLWAVGILWTILLVLIVWKLVN